MKIMRIWWKELQKIGCSSAVNARHFYSLRAKVTFIIMTVMSHSLLNGQEAVSPELTSLAHVGA